MHFQHSPDVWATYPELAAGVVFADGVGKDAVVDAQVDRFCALAESRLASGTESELPEIQAWRRTYAQMGLKPTQYRCAAESLLRRFRKERVLPRVHPLVDLCNAISLAFAVPVAVLDIACITGDLEVRHATGDEHYLTFGGDDEHPAPGEVIFADSAARAHARRWTNRQSGHSAVSDGTATVLVVAEAVHATAAPDVGDLVGAVVDGLADAWAVTPVSALLTRDAPRFELPV